MSPPLKCLVLCFAGLAAACGDEPGELTAPTAATPAVAATPTLAAAPATVARAIALNPTRLTYCFHPGSTRNCVVLKRRLRITSVSGAPLHWAAASNQPWIVVSPTSGTTTAPGTTPSKVTVSMDLSKVPRTHGDYISGLVTVSAPRASNSPQIATVSLSFIAIPLQ